MEPTISLDNSRILIVDDEKVNRNILCSLLNEYQTIVAKNGQQAIQRATSATPPDIILLDVVMPDMSGYDVCAYLNNNESTRHIPIIFITSQSTVEEEARGLELGAVDYISKPFSPSIVQIRVRNHLELKKHRDRLEQLNNTDGLTGIANRRHFDRTLQQCLSTSFQTQQPLSLVILDVDHFKQFNDFYGHVAGDDCLRKVAHAIAKCTDDTSLIARFGGEEFVALLSNTSKDQALKVAEKMRQAVAELNISHATSTTHNCITVSAGVASAYPSEVNSADSLLTKADESLYQAKQQGRNQVVVHAA